MRLTFKSEDLIKHATLHDADGTAELVEGVFRIVAGSSKTFQCSAVSPHLQEDSLP